MQHSDRIHAVAVLALTVTAALAAPSAAGAQVFKVGSFTKNTTSASGCASGCPTNVVAHGLGVRPKAIMLCTSGRASAGATTANDHCTSGCREGKEGRSVSVTSKK